MIIYLHIFDQVMILDNYIDVNDDSREWNEFSIPVVKGNEPVKTELNDVSENTAKTTPKKRVSTPVLTIQLTVCFVLLTVLFLLKTFSPAVFSDIKNWYDSELTASMYFNGDFANIDYSSLFDATSDEI